MLKIREDIGVGIPPGVACRKCGRTAKSGQLIVSDLVVVGHQQQHYVLHMECFMGFAEECLLFVERDVFGNVDMTRTREELIQLDKRLNGVL